MHPTKALSTRTMLKKTTRYSAYAMALSVCIGISASTASPNTVDGEASPWQQLTYSHHFRKAQVGDSKSK
ncbi:hypothetical protein EI164_15690, partial [Psychrobacter sp. FME13]|nr:hypothetical protein [Psychrobacter sp. FME13]